VKLSGPSLTPAPPGPKAPTVVVQFKSSVDGSAIGPAVSLPADTARDGMEMLVNRLKGSPDVSALPSCLPLCPRSTVLSSIVDRWFLLGRPRPLLLLPSHPQPSLYSREARRADQDPPPHLPSIRHPLPFSCHPRPPQRPRSRRRPLIHSRRRLHRRLRTSGRLESSRRRPVRLDPQRPRQPDLVLCYQSEREPGGDRCWRCDSEDLGSPDGAAQEHLGRSQRLGALRRMGSVGEVSCYGWT
jgi:hypothetical protein